MPEEGKEHRTVGPDGGEGRRTVGRLHVDSGGGIGGTEAAAHSTFSSSARRNSGVTGP
jgi:hypothetical protein